MSLSPLNVAFAEPEWRGDIDFASALSLDDLEAALSEIGDQIEAGVAAGWLGAYTARRARFDLESIRFQWRHAQSGGPPADATLRAILSRADRLAQVLDAARSAH